MGKATSSMMTVVPLLRTEPTEGNIPARIFQSAACAEAACVNCAGSSNLRREVESAARASSSARSDSNADWNSTSNPAAPSARVLITGGVPA